MVTLLDLLQHFALNFLFNPITYGILSFRQLRGGGGGGFLARIQKTRLQLTD